MLIRPGIIGSAQPRVVLEQELVAISALAIIANGTGITGRQEGDLAISHGGGYQGYPTISNGGIWTKIDVANRNNQYDSIAWALVEAGGTLDAAGWGGAYGSARSFGTWLFRGATFGGVTGTSGFGEFPSLPALAGGTPSDRWIAGYVLQSIGRTVHPVPDRDGDLTFETTDSNPQRTASVTETAEQDFAGDTIADIGTAASWTSFAANVRSS